MEFTGERVIPGQGDADLFNEHRARYWFARRFASGKNVLDAACGTGYGSALLAEIARAVVGVDVARDALDYARQHFHPPNLHFAQADCLVLPFPAGRFDLVVAFEIIEHLDGVEAFLAELHRVLDASGVLVLSTPNRLYYTDDRGEINPFHWKEFSYPEFDEVLRPHFPHRAILFQNHVAGLAISGPGAELNTAALSADCFFQENSAAPAIEASGRGAHFFVAVCSAQPIGRIEPLLYLPSAANILRERESYIHLLERRLSEKDAYVLGLQTDYESKIEWARSLESDLDKARAALGSLQADYDRDLAKARADVQSVQEDHARKIEWALSLESDLDKARAALGSLQADYDRDLAKARADVQSVQEDHARKIEWALSLESDLEQVRTNLDQLRKEFEERTAWTLRLDRDLQFLMDSRWYRLGKNLNLSPVPPSGRGPSDSGSR